MPKKNKYKLDYKKVVNLFQAGLSYEKASRLCGFPNKMTFGRHINYAISNGIISNKWTYNKEMDKG